MPEPTIRRIAVSTGGGDAPGLNAVVRAVVLASARRGWECHGIRDGLDGLIAPHNCFGPGVQLLTAESVQGIAHLGGTILGSSNRGNPFRFPTPLPSGGWTEEDRSDQLVAQCRARGFDALVMVGGDGTMAIADGLQRKGLTVIGVPKTIDNDLDRTHPTFGFDTASGFATDCIDRLHSTAQSHQRVIVVEVMGRYAGWIALHAGMAGGAHAILIPEIPFHIDAVADTIRARDAACRNHALVVVAEGAAPAGGQRELAVGALAGHSERLGGIGARVAQWLEQRTGKECRPVVLGYLLRGGSPSAFDRVVALRFGVAAVRALEQGRSGVMVALSGPDIDYVPLAEVVGHTKRVPVDGDTVQSARELGICLGEAA
jgi:6-phosphofructokinase 1